MEVKRFNNYEWVKTGLKTGASSLLTNLLLLINPSLRIKCVMVLVLKSLTWTRIRVPDVRSCQSPAAAADRSHQKSNPETTGRSSLLQEHTHTSHTAPFSNTHGHSIIHQTLTTSLSITGITLSTVRAAAVTLTISLLERKIHH